ncbi:MAG TPA: hypothetical protein P5567_13035 [Kiritimatiellia bacterium]|nr:hypothetical protein [Kiritimatiellia bacterium]HRZ13367.1 hypothetical protein [Kiritimatiellia bacterium]HSA18993.1 hypothetical protein [Kiritimatiellia bacterium]
MDEPTREESFRAVSGAMAIGAGQAAIILVSLCTTMLMPRLFGAEDFGRWVLFRSVISLAMILCVSGSSELMGRYYVALRAEGRDADAGRLFKLVFAFRLALAGLGALASGLLLAASTRVALGGEAAVLSGASVLLLVIGMSFHAVLYSERRMPRVAALNLLNASLVPAVVLAAYAAAGFRWVPRACVLGDALYALAAFALARGPMQWAAGWPPRARWPEYGRFVATAGFSNALVSVYGNLPPYLMAGAGMDAAQIAFMGLAVRVGDIVRMTLVSVGGALFPSITWVYEREGLDRALRWQGIATRFGAVAALAAAGVFAAAGGGLVRLVWGAAYDGAVPAIGLVLFSVVFLWIGFQHGWLGMLLKSATPFAAGSLALVLSFPLLFRVLGPAGGARGVAQAQFLCAAGFMALVMTHVRLGWKQGLPVARLAAPALAAAAAWPLGFGSRLGLPAGLAAAALWAACFAAVTFLSGSLRWAEVAEIAGRLRRAPGKPA